MKKNLSRRAVLRKKIRKYRDVNVWYRPFLNKRKEKWQSEYERLGFEIAASATLWGEPYGLDLSGAKLTDDHGNEIDKEEFFSIAVERVQGPFSDWGLKAREDKSVQVEYRWVDGGMQKYVDGIEEGSPLPPDSWGAYQDDDGKWHWKGSVL